MSPLPSRDSQVSLIGRDRQFGLLVESVTDYAIFMLDPEGHVASWNRGAERIKGYRADEVLGKHFSLFFPPEDVAAGKPAQVMAAALAQGRFEDEGLRVRKDGSRFLADVVITAVYDDGGAILGFAKVTRDVTERKRAEADAERARRTEELAELIELIPDGFLELDDELRTLAMNRQAEAITGRRREEVLGRGLSAIFPAGPGALFEEACRRARAERVAAHVVEASYEPERRWYETRVHPTRRGIALYFRDITDRKRAEEAEAEREKLLREMDESRRRIEALAEERARLLQRAEVALRARDVFLVAGCAGAGAVFLAFGALVSDLVLGVVDPRARE
jgi:PAS domain S-box-containing protein